MPALVFAHGGQHQRLRAASDSAKRLGYYGQQCESRLLLDELEVKSNPDLGRSELTQLADEAHEHGMEQIARKATALAAGTSGTAMVVATGVPH